jgi:hypothetical protein
MPIKVAVFVVPWRGKNGCGIENGVFFVEEGPDNFTLASVWIIEMILVKNTEFMDRRRGEGDTMGSHGDHLVTQIGWSATVYLVRGG